MRIVQPGRLAERLHFVGNVGVSLFFISGSRPTLIDAGMTIMGPLVREDLNRELGTQPLALHLLTHSHYDHVGCTPLLRHLYPELEIAAHKRVGEIVQRPNAVKLIRKLNASVVGGTLPTDDPNLVPFEPFDLSRELDDGDRIELGDGVRVEILHTPGHTQDSISYYLPHAKAVVPAEAAGVPGFDGVIQPEFLQSYQAYVASLDRLCHLETELILLPHNGVLSGDEAQGYMQRSLEATRRFRDRILIALDRHHGDEETAVDTLADELYTDQHGQPRDAFMINLRAMVRTIAEEQ